MLNRPIFFSVKCLYELDYEFEHFFFFLHPQRDGQTRNHHAIAPGHNIGQFTTRNVVTDAAHATRDGPGLSRENAGNVFREEFSFTSSVHFRGTFRQNEREKSSTFANFHQLEFSKKKKRQKKKEKKRAWTRIQIAVSYSELRLGLRPLTFQYSIVCFVKAAPMQNGFQTSFSLLWPRT